MNHLTDKQVQLLRVVLAGNPGGTPGTIEPVDLDQLIERLAYKPTKASIQFSIRALIARGLLEKGARIQRRDRLRAVYLATDLARQVMTLESNPGMVENPTPPLPEVADLREAQPALPVESPKGVNLDSEVVFLDSDDSETPGTPEVFDL
jgi:hypothetical protein